MLTRRHSFRLIGGAAVGFAIQVRSYAAESAKVIETQRGDVGLPTESMLYDPAAISAIIDTSKRATFEERDIDFRQHLIDEAATFVGDGRDNTPDKISDFLELFRLPLKYDNGRFVPYCAAGVAFAAASAYAKMLKMNFDEINKVSRFRSILADIEHWYFYPTPSVYSLYHVSEGTGRWISASPSSKPVPKPGWLVVYDWSRGTNFEHVGIVESVSKDADVLHTIEFNTTEGGKGSQANGGKVARRTRVYDDTVRGFVKTDAPPRF